MGFGYSPVQFDFNQTENKWHPPLKFDPNVMGQMPLNNSYSTFQNNYILPFNSNNFSMGFMPTFGNSSSKPLTEEEKIELENAKAEKRLKLQRERDKVNKYTSKLKQSYNELKDYVVDQDGNYTREKKLKDATFGEKAKTVFSGILNGGMKLFEAFIPKKKDGKVDWGQTALRVGVAALAFGATFIPVAGPVISAFLFAAGVASGGALIGSEPMNLCVHSERLAVSFGAPKGREFAKSISSISKCDMESIVYYCRENGYDGIIISYEAMRRVQPSAYNELEQLLGEADFSNSSYVFWSLEDLA